MDTSLIIAASASGGWTDMLFVAGAGALMLAAVGALAAAQSRGGGPAPGTDRPDTRKDDPS
jgi:hypothetical protein